MYLATFISFYMDKQIFSEAWMSLTLSKSSFKCPEFFVRDGIYNSVADYNSTWWVSSVCVCVSVCLSRGKLCYWVTFERFELEG